MSIDMMKPIIDLIDKATLKSELNSSTFVRNTNNGNNEIYIINDNNAPNTLKEIGRLREVTFRAAGGGTGKDCDLDEFDLGPRCYEQLIVWNPIDMEIVGGYRFIRCDKALDEHGHHHLATTELFTFSETFKTNYLPYTIELGRSFIQPQYQPSSSNRKGLFSLVTLWDGLGALVVDHKDIRYFFGKVTMYRHYDVAARDHIMAFMDYYFPDHDQLVTPIFRVIPQTDTTAFVTALKGLPYKEGHRLLNAYVRERDEFIPPLVNSYMNLSATMKNFGTAVNGEFGDVDETGIMVTIADIYDSKKERHVTSYIEELKARE